jgi:hypothetical protein
MLNVSNRKQHFSALPRASKHSLDLLLAYDRFLSQDTQRTGWVWKGDHWWRSMATSRSGRHQGSVESEHRLTNHKSTTSALRTCFTGLNLTTEKRAEDVHDPRAQPIHPDSRHHDLFQRV